MNVALNFGKMIKTRCYFDSSRHKYGIQEVLKQCFKSSMIINNNWNHAVLIECALAFFRSYFDRTPLILSKRLLLANSHLFLPELWVSVCVLELWCVSKYGSPIATKMRLLDQNHLRLLTTAYDLDLDIDQVNLIFWPWTW